MFRKRDEIDSTSRYHLPPRGGCRLGFGGLIQAVKNQDLYTKGSQNSISWKDNKMALQFYKFVTYKYNTNLIHLQLCKISKIISYAQHSSSLYVHRCNENWDTKQKKKKPKETRKLPIVLLLLWRLRDTPRLSVFRRPTNLGSSGFVRCKLSASSFWLTAADVESLNDVALLDNLLQSAPQQH